MLRGCELPAIRLQQWRHFVLNDDKTIQVTESMLLATAQLDKKLPLTPSQQIKLKGFIFCYAWRLR